MGLHYAIYQLYLRGYYLLMLPLYVLCGFFMWCVFVVGHDCGHGTFSDSEVLNIVCGLFTHCSLLVPFQAWARSHRFHHLNHNHHEKDYSFPWVHDQSYDSAGVKFLDRNPGFRAFIYPILGYFIYLNLPTTDAGGIDGNHYFPHLFKNDRMWHGIETKELILCWISTICVGFYIYGFTSFLYEGSFVAFLVCYMPSWIGFCYFLFTVDENVFKNFKKRIRHTS